MRLYTYTHIHACVHIYEINTYTYILMWTVRSVRMSNKCSISVKGTYFKETFNDICYKNKYLNSISRKFGKREMVTCIWR